MKTQIAALLLALPVIAHAESFFQVEVGVGMASATEDGDIMYYDAGLPHHTPVNGPGARIGLVATLREAETKSWVPGVRMHLGYTYWGAESWSATVGEDFNGSYGYSTLTKNCVNTCGQIRTFISGGSMHSVNLTIEPYWDLGGGWTVGAEAGPAIYFDPWTSAFVANESGPFGPAGSIQQVSHHVVPELGAVVGLSVSKGPFSIRYNYLYGRNRSAGGTDVPSGIKGAHLITANYTF